MGYYRLEIMEIVDRMYNLFAHAESFNKRDWTSPAKLDKILKNQRKLVIRMYNYCLDAER